MSARNLSPTAMFQALAAEHSPKYAFSATSAEEFRAWRAEALPAVRATLGQMPPRVAPNAEMIAEVPGEGGITKQRWYIDVGPHISAILQVNYPPGFDPDGSTPALLCWHGHGAYGKEPVMGNTDNPAIRDNARFHNYDYGLQMAQQGFVTYAIDWMPGGDRNDKNKPNYHSMAGDRDWCNILYLHASIMGSTVIAYNVTHGMAATDFVASLPGVDGENIGVMGLSGGGTMTLWSTLVDERFKASEIMCYSDRFADFGFSHANYCGMQVSPGLYALCDLPDLQGLICPRPLLVDIGLQDSCFRIENAMSCYRHVENIYTIAGARENLELDLFDGEHAWGGNKAPDFFRRHLGVS